MKYMKLYALGLSTAYGLTYCVVNNQCISIAAGAAGGGILCLLVMIDGWLS